MLEHVSGIDGIHGVRSERKPVAHVQPEIDFVKEVRVQIYEIGQVLRAASKMQMTGTGPDPCVGHVTAQVIIAKSGFRDSPEYYVLIALVIG